MAGKKRKLEDLTMDEFMSGAFDSSSSESDKKVKPAVKKTAKAKKTKKSPKQKKSLKERLKDQDPEFLEFLKGEDESLLDMEDDVSDSDDSNYNDDIITDNKKHSDDDDIDLPESSDNDTEVTSKMKKPVKKKKDRKLTKNKTKTSGQEIDKIQTDKEKVQAKKDKSEKDSVDKRKHIKGEGIETDKKVGKKAAKSKSNSNKVSSKKPKATVEEEDDDIIDDDDNDDLDIDIDDVDEDEPLEFEDIEEASDSEEERLHIPPESLEVMTDSEDDVDDDRSESRKKSGRGVKVTVQMIQQWSKRFKELPSPALVHEAVYAFKAAVQQASPDVVSTKYKVVGSKVFNGVIRMCLVEIPQALHKILDLPVVTDLQKPVLPSSKNVKWKKVRVDMKTYLVDVLQLLSNLSQANMVNVLMKHIHKLVAFYACFPKLTKTLLKKVIVVWSSGEETSRVLAFLCINRLIRLQQSTMLEPCLKQMYMAYVKNCKFTSPNALPMINFMQRSLVEILSLDFALAYQYAFIYIRQLAIHLRNAISTKKKESCQAVYNWQYIHCLSLWVQLLSLTYPNDVLEPLIYPLTQTIIGTIKLVPTQKYYPLRFHCVRALTMLSKSTGTFIPVLPFLLEVFEQTDFNKKHKAISIKPINFACILKLSKVQLQERSFKDGVIDQLYELLVEHFSVHAHTIGFPELALPSVLQLKDFLKKCKVGNFTKQIKQIVEKLDENSKYITNRRRSATISLSDTKAIDTWERQCREAGTPLGKFYTTWRKLRDRELMHQIAQKDQIVGEDGLPEIVKPKVPVKASDEEKKEFAALFDTDSEDDMDMTESFLPVKDKKKKGKDKQSKAKMEDSGSEGDYSDFDSDELEQLAGSGDDDSDDNMDDDDVDAESPSDGDNDDVEGSSNDDIGSDNDESDNNDESDDLEGKEDIVKDFSLSSDEED